jgi:hypothetical protein
MRTAWRTSSRAAASVALVAAFALAPLLLGTPPARAAGADITRTTNPVEVTIEQLRPIAPQPGDTLVISGTLLNTTDAPLPDLNYALKLSTTFLSTRGEFDSYGNDQDGDFSTAPVPMVTANDTVTQAQTPTLAAGASEPFRITESVDALASSFQLTTAWQVREMGVSVSSYDTPVGHVRTFLPWAPRASPETPLGVAWILPLTERPHRTTSTDWFDDSLAAELAPSARLGALVAAGNTAESQVGHGKHPVTTSVPVTWAIDPMLVRDVRDMTASGGYKVTTPSGTTTAGRGAAAAKTYLQALRGAVAKPDAGVLALPYGDPDVVAAVRANLSSAIGLAAVNGRNLLEQILGVTPTTNYAWPPGGFADERTVSALTAIGESPLILSDAALPPVLTPSATPNALTSLTTTNGPTPTLLTDSGLTDDVISGNSAGVSNPDGSRVSLQRYLAETLMIHAESPSTSGRNVIVAPGRHWAPSVGYATQVLADTGKVPWIAPTSLSDVTHSTADTTIHRSLVYPASARNNELPQSYLAQVRQLRSQIANFGTILTHDNSQVLDLTTASQQALSTDWRGDRTAALTALNSLRSEVEKAVAQVKVASHANSYITLTSHGGKVPVTIENDLPTPVRVMVRLSSHHRLELPNNGRLIEDLPAHQLTRVDFRATANTSGVFQVQVQLLTPDGKHKYGAPVALYVKSTVYGTITLVITGAATGALLIAVAVRLTRRALAARRSAASTAS